MSVTPIRLFGDPVLRTPAAPVVDFDAELRRLVGDLTDTMRAASGAGLAAPQIGVGLRVFTYEVGGVLGHVVNPMIEEFSEEQQESDEGCLSFPGIYVPCVRPKRLRAVGFDQYGEPLMINGEDMLARAVYHEVDHLDGVLFIDRLDIATRKLAMKAVREADWANEPVPQIKLSPHSPLGL